AEVVRRAQLGVPGNETVAVRRRGRAAERVAEANAEQHVLAEASIEPEHHTRRRDADTGRDLVPIPVPDRTRVFLPVVIEAVVLVRLPAVTDGELGRVIERVLLRAQ